MGLQKGNSFGQGRPKGRKNKIPTDLRDAIYIAFEERGGVDFLRKLGDRDFVTLLKTILPIELKAHIKNEFAGPPHESFLRELAKRNQGQQRIVEN